MASKNDEPRSIRFLQQLLWWAFAAGVVLVAALGALLCTTGEASAQTITVPGLGAIDIPNEIAIPAGIPGMSVSIPQQESADLAAPSPTEFSAPGITFTLPGLPGLEKLDLAWIPGFKPPTPLQPNLTPHKSTGELAVDAARAKLGADYSGGSAGPDAFDCSGLVQWSYEQAGVSVPRTSYDQLAAGTPVAQEDLRPGDVVSFYGGGHSAIYAGDGKVIHASTYGTGVVESPMATMPYAGACRFQN